jgi:hypothetical protein
LKIGPTEQDDRWPALVPSLLVPIAITLMLR